jgi:hypothetical protein
MQSVRYSTKSQMSGIPAYSCYMACFQFQFQLVRCAHFVSITPIMIMINNARCRSPSMPDNQLSRRSKEKEKHNSSIALVPKTLHAKPECPEEARKICQMVHDHNAVIVSNTEVGADTQVRWYKMQESRPRRIREDSDGAEREADDVEKDVFAARDLDLLNEC